VGGTKRISRDELRELSISAVARCLRFFGNNWILIVGTTFVAAILVISSIWNWDYWSELTLDESHKIKEIRLDRTRIIQQLLFVVGGFAAFILAGWRTWTAHTQAKAALSQVQVALRQADLAERAHNVDRYTRAANMLDSDKIAVRQAAVYTLLQLGRADTANFYNLVIRLLAGFARVRSAEFTKQQTLEEHKKQLNFSYREPNVETDETVEFSDLYDAVSSIGWLREQRPNEVEAERTAKFVLDLSGIVGARTSFVETDFSLVNLRGADFTGSYFRLAKFGRADLRYGNFHGVNVQWSSFARALLQNSDLELAHFDACNFENASFAAAELKSTSFSRCNVSRAQFAGASSFTAEAIADAWAWTDMPPSLPNGVKFENLVNPGPRGEIRALYIQMRPSGRGFGPPD
jgi:uncharacterized protein YjbI with pentapeptide repeats